jgi:hypothetical protein
LRIIRELIEFEPKSLKYCPSFKIFYPVLRKVVFVISDFMAEDYEHTLKIAKKHDITGIRVYDVREQKMPDMVWCRCSMLKQAKQLINTGSKTVRFNYEKHYNERLNYFKTFSQVRFSS